MMDISFMAGVLIVLYCGDRGWHWGADVFSRGTASSAALLCAVLLVLFDERVQLPAVVALLSGLMLRQKSLPLLMACVALAALLEHQYSPGRLWWQDAVAALKRSNAAIAAANQAAATAAAATDAVPPATAAEQ
jgi:hypothetical protein